MLVRQVVMDVVVRDACLPDDRRRIIALYQETMSWHGERWPDDVRAVDMSSLFDEMPAMDDASCLRVAEVDGEVLGLISANVMPAPTQGMDRYDGPILWIGDVVVTAQARRCGIGTRLLQDVEQWGRARGAVTVTLQVHAGNTAAESLYRCQGFRDVHIRMRKDLS